MMEHLKIYCFGMYRCFKQYIFDMKRLSADKNINYIYLTERCKKKKKCVNMNLL